MRTLTTIALVLAACACLVAPTPAQTVTRSELISDDALTDVTDRKELTHEFSQKPEKVRVSVKCKLKSGEFAWRVESPDGTVLWEQRFEGKGNLELTEELPGAAGEWRIVLDYTEARGRYRIKMEQVGHASAR